MKFFLYTLLVYVLFGCTPDQLGENQAFILANDFSDERCETVAECDCCSADLILLPDHKFGLVDRCLGGDTYFAGEYSVHEKQLTLNFRRDFVDEIQDEDYNVTGYTKDNIDIDPWLLQITICSGKFHLANIKDSTIWKSGSRHKPEIERELISELLGSEAWKQLMPQ